MANDDLTIRLLVSPSEAANLAALMEKLGLTEMKELVNISLSLLQWTVAEISKGNDVASINSERTHFTILGMVELNALRGTLN